MANMGHNRPEASWMDEKPHKLTESKLGGDQKEHIYEPLPPNQDDPYRLQTNNPFANEASTKVDPFSGDGVQFSFSGDPLDPFQPFPHHP